MQWHDWDRPRALEEVMTAQKKDDRRFGGLVPAPVEEGSSVWPPRGPIGWSLLTTLKRIEAFFTRGELVWLRDHDETQTLAVAHRGRDGVLYSARYWPWFRSLQLNDNGFVICLDKGNGEYVRNWIASDDAKMVYMLMQNSETYANPMDDYPQPTTIAT
jgi:hypothetical protein